jgi:hypothetical protein
MHGQEGSAVSAGLCDSADELASGDRHRYPIQTAISAVHKRFSRFV